MYGFADLDGAARYSSLPGNGLQQPCGVREELGLAVEAAGSVVHEGLRQLRAELSLPRATNMRRNSNKFSNSIIL